MASSGQSPEPSQRPNVVPLPRPPRQTVATVAVALLRTLRPHQWVKNLFVVAPLLFAQKLLDPASLWRAGAAAAAFCLLSGAVYVVNDVLDIEKDRAHPRKCHRPIPAGILSIRTAIASAVGLLVVSVALCIPLGPWVALAALGYAGQNLLYSLRLKHIAFLDVLSIATGFLLRVLAGSFAIGVEPSGWLLLCTGLLASFLGFGKRAHELATSGAAAAAQRSVLEQYRLSHLRAALYTLALATIVAYVMYTRAAHTVAFFHTSRLLWTSPFCALGITRFLHLVERSPKADSPTDAMLRDWPFLLNLVVWAAVVTAIIYRYR